MRIALGGVDEIVIGRGDARSIERKREGERTIVRVTVPDRRMSGEHVKIVVE